MIKLRGYDDAYLYVARPLDPRVLDQLQATQESVAEFADLEARRIGVQVAFGLMYTVIALIVLLSAVWIGLEFRQPAGRADPAPDRRRQRGLDRQSLCAGAGARAEGDLAQLGETFNKMTQELRTQRDELDARARPDRQPPPVHRGGAGRRECRRHRRRRRGNISILNRSAEKLIGHSEAEALGRNRWPRSCRSLSRCSTSAHPACSGWCRGRSRINRDGRERNLSVRVTTEQSGDAEHGYVVTLDDITELVTAQRTSAWADIARRIAHEIKNPLTPIQLSAERLRRKYGKVITEDKRDVRAVHRHHRAPGRRHQPHGRRVLALRPHAEAGDRGRGCRRTVRQVVFLMRSAIPTSTSKSRSSRGPMPARFDRRLISQALTNIVKNATEAIAAVPPDELGRGRIRVTATREGDDIVIDVIDNGIGLPKENRNRLLEPYVTTREKGTGLGLAIVGRILEEHGGGIELLDAPRSRPAGAARGCGCASRPRPIGSDQRAPKHPKSVEASERAVDPWRPTF